MSSIQMPDKYLHAIGEGTASEEWVQSEAPIFDDKIGELVMYCEANDISWVLFGDHGSPHPGTMKKNRYILPRHRKESIVMASDGLEPPTHSDEFYDWLLDIYGVDPVDPSDLSLDGDGDRSDVNDRLEALGYK